MLPRNLRYIAVVLALLIAATPVSAQMLPTSTAPVAQSDETQVVVPVGESIKLGLATDLSNLIPEFGEDIANGATIAVDQRNEAGGIQGFEIELVVEDDRCDPQDATNVANQFAADPQIVAVVGHVCSGASINASGIYEQARIPMVSPSSTNELFTANGYDVANRVAFTDAAQGTVDARYLYSELGVRRLSVIHDKSDYGKGLADVVVREFERLGGEIVSYDEIDIDEQDYRSVLTPLVEDAPDAIFFGGYQGQAALLVNQMLEVGLEDTIFFSDDGIFGQQFLDNAGDASEGVYASFVIEGEGNTEANEAFDEAYEEAFGVAPDEKGPFHAHAFDSATIILNAIESVAELDGEGNLVINREDLIQAIRDTENYEGLTGVLSCDAVGECGAGEIGINIVEDGEWVAVDVPAELQYGEPFMMDEDMEDMEEGEDEMEEDMEESEDEMEDSEEEGEMEATEEASE